MAICQVLVELQRSIFELSLWKIGSKCATSPRNRLKMVNKNRQEKKSA